MLTIIAIGWVINLVILLIAFAREGHWVFVDWNPLDLISVLIPYGVLIVPLILLITKPWR